MKDDGRASKDVKYVGAAVRGVGLERFLTGSGHYIDDLKLPGMAYLHFLRTPYAHAKIRSINYSSALEYPGVLGVWTGKDIAPDVRPVRPVLDSEAYRGTEWPALAKEKVRYVGEAVAAIVAESRYLAEDAAEMILVDYAALPPLHDVSTSLNCNGVCLHEELKNNIFFEYRFETGNFQEAFRQAELRIALEFKHPRCAASAIENRGVVAQYQPYRQLLTIWSSTQIPDLLRDVVGESLQFPTHRIRVIAPDVGGGFGVKMHVYPEELITAFLARKLGRPVKWIEDRRENLLASTHARDHKMEAEIAARRDGTILGIQVRDLSDVGAYLAFPITCALETLTFANGVPGPYKVESISFHGMAIGTNKCPVGAYRGVGFVLGPLVMEGLIDALARALRKDPADVRRTNLIGAVRESYRAPSGIVYDGGDYRKAFEEALELSSYHEWRKEQTKLRAEGRYLGIGLAAFIEPTGMGQRAFKHRGMAEVPGFDSATVRMDSDGTVRAYISTPSQGQGQETTFAQILADEIGVKIDDVIISLGDTETCPFGTGTFASRSLVSGGSALVLAARELRQRLLCAAGHLLRIPPVALEIRQGKVWAKERLDSVLSVEDLTRAVHSPSYNAAGDALNLVVTRSFSVGGAAVSYGTHVAVVEVDPETGLVYLREYAVVEDCGNVINPAVVDGQIRGGIAQGIGTAIYEELRYDDNGQLLTASFMDYLIPGSLDVPAIQIEHLTTPSPLTPTGSKGVGESGTIASPAALASAISDALSPFDVCFTQLPIRPAGIVEMLQGRYPSPTYSGVAVGEK